MAISWSADVLSIDRAYGMMKKSDELFKKICNFDAHIDVEGRDESKILAIDYKGEKCSDDKYDCDR